MEDCVRDLPPPNKKKTGYGFAVSTMLKLATDTLVASCRVIIEYKLPVGGGAFADHPRVDTSNPPMK